MPSRSDQSELLKTPEAAEKETTPLGSTDPGVVAEQRPAESPLPCDRGELSCGTADPAVPRRAGVPSARTAGTAVPH